MPDSKTYRRHDTLYALTALLALGVALISVLNIEQIGARNAVAIVNATPVPQAEYARALDAMQAGLERPLTEADRTRALKLLIDEELIVQDALQLGLAGSDRLVRKNLVQAMIRSATSLSEQSDISEAEQRRFYGENAALFATPESFHFETVRFRTEENVALFLQTLETGLSFSEAAAQAGASAPEVVAGLPIGKIGVVLGGPAAELIIQMKAGDIAGPVTSGEDQLFIWLKDRTGGARAFESVQEAVQTEMQRRRDEAALEAYIARLRARARIQMMTAEK